MLEEICNGLSFLYAQALFGTWGPLKRTNPVKTETCLVIKLLTTRMKVPRNSARNSLTVWLLRAATDCSFSITLNVVIVYQIILVSTPNIKSVYTTTVLRLNVLNYSLEMKHIKYEEKYDHLSSNIFAGKVDNSFDFLNISKWTTWFLLLENIEKFAMTLSSTSHLSTH